MKISKNNNKKKPLVRRIISNVFLCFAVCLFIFVLTSTFTLGKQNKDIFILGFKPYIITTGSMETTYMANSFVIIQKGGYDDIKIGDVIAFKSSALNGETAFHRVVNITKDGFITKGDYNNNPDNQVIGQDQYIGHEVFHTNFTAWYYNGLREPFGVIKLVVLPALCLIMLILAFHWLTHSWDADFRTKGLAISSVVFIIIVACLIAYIIYKNQRVNYVNTRLAETTDTFIDNNQTSTDTTVDGNKVYGVVQIEKVGIEYPIIVYQGAWSLDVSIAHFSGPSLNQPGNVVLAGHRGYNDIFFTKIDQLREGDIVKITDSSNTVISYKVISYFETDANDTSILQPASDGVRELTLISCSSNWQDRYIVKLVEATD